MRTSGPKNHSDEKSAKINFNKAIKSNFNKINKCSNIKRDASIIIYIRLLLHFLINSLTVKIYLLVID